MCLNISQQRLIIIVHNKKEIIKRRVGVAIHLFDESNKIYIVNIRSPSVTKYVGHSFKNISIQIRLGSYKRNVSFSR